LQFAHFRTHELKRSIVVKEARNLTWVGIGTTTSGIRDVTINCTGVSGVVMFWNVVNLNVTGITFTYCGKVPFTKGLPIAALIFSDVFNIQLGLSISIYDNMPTRQIGIDSKQHKTTQLLFQFIAVAQKTVTCLRCPLTSDVVTRHTLTFEYSGIPSTW